MFPIIRVAAFVLFLSWTFAGCRQTPAPAPRLPVPGARPPIPSKVIRASLDKSPMDMLYFPVDYPVLKMTGKSNELPIARVIYSRPEKDGRVIFGNVVKYNEHWRLGANEATELEFFTDVNILSKTVKKGRYVLYCIPYPDKWTVILNNDLFVWGLKIHSSKDMYSFDVPATTTGDVYEVLTMEFVPHENGMNLSMAWDNVKAVLPINY